MAAKKQEKPQIDPLTRNSIFEIDFLGFGIRDQKTSFIFRKEKQIETKSWK